MLFLPDFNETWIFYIDRHVKYTLFLSDFNETWIFYIDRHVKYPNVILARL